MEIKNSLNTGRDVDPSSRWTAWFKGSFESTNFLLFRYQPKPRIISTPIYYDCKKHRGKGTTRRVEEGTWHEQLATRRSCSAFRNCRLLRGKSLITIIKMELIFAPTACALTVQIHDQFHQTKTWKKKICKNSNSIFDAKSKKNHVQ